MIITLHYNESSKVYQATGEDAKIVWEALGLNITFKLAENLPVSVAPENVENFTQKMSEYYNIKVITTK